MRRRLPSADARRFAIALPAVAACLVVLGGANLTAADAAPRGACTIAVVDDAYSTPQDTALTVADPGVTSNDTLCGTDGLVISASQPTHGTLADFDDSGGGFTYTPDPGFTGTDSFTYTLEDVQSSPVGTVTLTVTEAATTSTESTTTTTAPTTTTTGATTSTSSAPTSTSVAGRALAVTGSNAGSLAMLGLALVSAGLVSTAAARRRTRA
jgi:hypothetical protein